MNLHKKFFSKIGFNYLIYLISALVFQIILINVLGVMNSDLSYNYNVITILSAVSNYILPFPILLFLMKKLESENLEKHSLNIKTFIIYLCITFTLMWIGNVIGLAITYLIGNSIQVEVSNPIQELINTTDIWLNLVLISIIAPIFEEIFFRKLLIDRTIKYGAVISILLSATIFGLMHGNLNQFFYAFLMGGFLAYVYIKTGKITYTIILHMIVNLMGSVVSLFVVESANALTQGTYTTFDMGLLLLYLIFIVIVLIVGAVGLFRFKKSELSKYKPEIELEQPLRTAFINYGMICFIAFSIAIIIYQIF
ncbi:CPBP family intramembrane glutamic endopeptidase [Methanobrevibacter sp.]|uniref:CPBP family intramembrane glutamic endopeptidase n=1 Tax=Methanobrevibacter sp. TaxID=66852 RepID=UPI00386A5A6D